MLHELFDKVLKEMIQECKHVGFSLILPDDKSIPQSRIAQTLHEKLILIINESGNSNDNDNGNDSGNVSGNDKNKAVENNSIVGKKNKKICLQIIDTFRQLFDKYIDSRHAVFMVNVSSRNRENLIKLFDTHYYNHNYNRNSQNKNNSHGILSNGAKLMKKMSKRLIIDNEIEMKRSVINDNLDEKCSQLNDDDLIKWLLLTIMQQFEANVREITFLMNDSFSRFRIDENELYLRLSVVTNSHSNIQP